MADQWLQNEMGDEKMSFKAHEKGTSWRPFCSASIFNLNHLNTAHEREKH